MSGKYYVYVLEILETNEIFYCGKGKGRRCHEHSFRYKNKDKQYLRVYKKINKILQDGLTFRPRIVFWTDNEEEAYAKEIELIKIIGRENLTNLTDGGDGSSFVKHTEETKKRIGDINRGRKHTPETIELMRKVHTGIFPTEEDKIKTKEGMKNSGAYQRTRQEARERMSRRVRRLDTGEEFDSVITAAKSICRGAGTLSAAITANRACNGIMFEYISESEFQPKRPKRKDFKHSKLTRDKMSKNFEEHPDKEKFIEQLRKQAEETRKPVRRLDTGKIYDSITEAAQDMGVKISSVSAALSSNWLCQGIKLEYYDPNKPDFTPILRKIPKMRLPILNETSGERFETIELAAASIGATTNTLYAAICRGGLCKNTKFSFIYD